MAGKTSIEASKPGLAVKRRIRYVIDLRPTSLRMRHKRFRKIKVLCTAAFLVTFVVVANIYQLSSIQDTRREDLDPLVLISQEEHKQLKLFSEKVGNYKLRTNKKDIRYVKVEKSEIILHMQFSNDFNSKVDTVRALLDNPIINIMGKQEEVVPADNLLPRKATPLDHSDINTRRTLLVYTSSHSSLLAVQNSFPNMDKVFFLQAFKRGPSSAAEINQASMAIEDLIKWWPSCNVGEARAILPRLRSLFLDRSYKPLCEQHNICSAGSWGKLTSLCKKNNLVVDASYLDKDLIYTIRGRHESMRVVFFLDKVIYEDLMAVIDSADKDAWFSFKDLWEPLTLDTFKHDAHTEAFFHALKIATFALINDAYPWNRAYGLFKAESLLENLRQTQLEVGNFADIPFYIEDSAEETEEEAVQ